MKQQLIALALVCMGLANSAMAQSAAGPAAKDDSLYQALGQKAGLVALMNLFVPALKADPRIGPQFKDTKAAYLQEQLVDQFCVVTGGPCEYKGADMKSAHAGMEINKGDFNRLVEVLQTSMDASGIPFATQNKLLARLAPMHRDVITAK
jgi:hemoglobin